MKVQTGSHVLTFFVALSFAGASLLPVAAQAKHCRDEHGRFARCPGAEKSAPAHHPKNKTKEAKAHKKTHA